VFGIEYAHIDSECSLSIAEKGGKNPSVKLNNFIKMLNKKNIDMVGLALVVKGYPYPFLLSYRRFTHLGEKAQITIHKNKQKRR
jgi:hypothetical protein